MALPSESSTPPQGQGLPYPPGDSKLEMMPTEILSQAFGNLSLGDGQSFPCPGWKVLKANRRAYRDFRSLCLTSKRVDSVARPLLFRKVRVRSPAALLQLYEALLSNKYLGCHIREISFEISTVEDGVALCDFFPLPSSQSANLLVGWNQNTSARATWRQSESSDYCCDQIISRAYFEILLMTPSANRLALRMNAVELRHTDSTLQYQSFFKRVKQAVESPHAGDSSQFLPQLKELQLLGGYWKAIDITICKPLLQIPTLQKITTLRDNGRWSGLLARNSDTPEAGHAFKNIKAAELQQVACHPRDFRALGILLADLEVLKISSRPTGPLSLYEPEHQFDKGNGYLRNSFAQMKNLHTLIFDLNWGRSAYDYMRPGDMDPNLASLPKLTTVKIPLAILVGGIDITDYDVIYLDRNLPPSLKQLAVTINCFVENYLWNETLRSLKFDADPPAMLHLLGRISSLGHQAFPALQEIICCYRFCDSGCPAMGQINELGQRVTPEKWWDYFGFDSDNYVCLDQLRVMLQSQQIRFRVIVEDVPDHPNRTIFRNET